jgi:hypothetical protein
LSNPPKKSSGDKVVIKKVMPYPFTASLELGARKMVVQVMKITTRSVLVDPGAGILQVGETWKLVADLPGRSGLVSDEVKIMKTYDRAVDSKTPQLRVERMAELLFLKLADLSRRNIQHFASLIKQD